MGTSTQHKHCVFASTSLQIDKNSLLELCPKSVAFPKMAARSGALATGHFGLRTRQMPALMVLETLKASVSDARSLGEIMKYLSPIGLLAVSIALTACQTTTAPIPDTGSGTGNTGATPLPGAGSGNVGASLSTSFESTSNSFDITVNDETFTASFVQSEDGLDSYKNGNRYVITSSDQTGGSVFLVVDDLSQASPSSGPTNFFAASYDSVAGPIPTTGTGQLTGGYIGFVRQADNSFSPGFVLGYIGADATFDLDFAAKSVTGRLTNRDLFDMDDNLQFAGGEDIVFSTGVMDTFGDFSGTISGGKIALTTYVGGGVSGTYDASLSNNADILAGTSSTPFSTILGNAKILHVTGSDSGAGPIYDEIGIFSADDADE